MRQSQRLIGHLQGHEEGLWTLVHLTNQKQSDAPKSDMVPLILTDKMIDFM